MEAEQLKDILATDSSITAIVGDRIVAGRGLAGVELPAIQISNLTEPGERTQIIQLDGWTTGAASEAKAPAAELQATLIAKLQSYLPTVAGLTKILRNNCVAVPSMASARVRTDYRVSIDVLFEGAN